MPDAPHLVLWQAVTTLREHRGDGHNAALLQREVDGAAAHVLAAAAGRSTREWLMRARGWSDEDWAAAVGRLSDRGWLDGAELTAEGLAMVAAIEADTDRLALGPWRTLGDVGCDRLAELLAPVRRAVIAAGDWPEHNPIGVPDPG
jgi:glutathione S-transferase